MRMNVVQMRVVEAGRSRGVVRRGDQRRIYGRGIALRGLLAGRKGADGRGLHVECG